MISFLKKLFTGARKGPKCGICGKNFPHPDDLGLGSGLPGRTCKGCSAVFHTECLGPIEDNPCPKCGGRHWRWWPD